MNSWKILDIRVCIFQFKHKSCTSRRFWFKIFFPLVNLFDGERGGRWLEICRLKWVRVLAVARPFVWRFCVCSQKESEWIHVGSLAECVPWQLLFDYKINTEKKVQWKRFYFQISNSLSNQLYFLVVLVCFPPFHVASRCAP